VTTTKDLTLIDIMEHLGAAWSTCGEADGAVLGLLLRWDSVSDAVADGETEAAALIVRTAESTCPGLLAAARIYAQHVEAGWPHPYDEQRVRALFTEHMGRDPFGQPTPG
jgi:hypothetical protein